MSEAPFKQTKWSLFLCFRPNLLFGLCSRFCCGPISHHSAHHRGASITYPLQNRATSPGAGASSATFISLWAPATVPDELGLACVVGGWKPRPWPANWCSQAWRKPHRLPHSERPWALLHVCPAKLQPNKSCTAAVRHIQPNPPPSAPGCQLSVNRLSDASNRTERVSTLWACGQSGTSLWGGGEQQ